MFVGVIFFWGPKSRWGFVADADRLLEARIDPSEIIWRSPRPLPWHWLARSEMLAKFRGLDQTKCGYSLMSGSICVEQHVPSLEA